MGRKEKIFKKADILEAIKGSGGTISTIAEALKCDWHTAKKNIEKHEETRKALDGELETGLDKIEGKAHELALDGDGAMIRFILATKGRERGYGDKAPQKVDDAEDNELIIEIVDGDDDD